MRVEGFAVDNQYRFIKCSWIFYGAYLRHAPIIFEGFHQRPGMNSTQSHQTSSLPRRRTPGEFSTGRFMPAQSLKFVINWIALVIVYI